MKLALKTLLTLILLGFLAYQMDLRAFAGVVASAHLLILLPAVMVQIILILVSVKRWQSVLGNFEIHSDFLSLTRLAFMGAFFNLFLPSSIGGDVFRAYYLARQERRGLSTTLTTILLERSGGLFALLVIGTAAAFVEGIEVQGVSILHLFLLVVVGYAAANLVLFNPRLHNLLTRILRRLHRQGLEARMELVYQGLRTLSRNTRTIGIVVSLSLVIQFFSVSIVWISAQALSIDIPFYVFLVFIPMINLTIMVPLTINGFGLRESLYLLLFAQAGLPPEQAVALSLLNTLVVMVASLPGAVIYSLYKRDDGFDRVLAEAELKTKG